MSEERVERVLAGYAAFNRGDLDAALAGMSEDIEWEALDVMPDQGPFRGTAGVLRFWDGWRESFDEFQTVIDEVFEMGDNVIAVMHVSGRLRGSEAEMSAPPFAQVWSFAGDEIVRVRMVAGKDEALSLAAEEPAG
jgi:ketosteroid isomerase-like protein